MKYVFLVALLGFLGYEIFVLIKTIIAKKNAKKLLAELNSKNNGNNDNVKVL